MPERWGCPVCGTVYATKLFGGCPRHPGTPLEEEVTDMPKITVAGGPSNPDAEPGQPGYIPPEDEKPKGRGKVVRRTTDADTETPAVETVRETSTSKREGGEGPSPGSSSQTSTEKQQPKPSGSGDSGQQRAPTTDSPSSSPRTAGSSVRGTGGGRTTGSKGT